jgi:hypothetical protein
MKDSGSAPVGARNDDSTLFSLDALKKTDDTRAKDKGRDDSGLIDLKALAAMEREDRPKQEVAVATIVAPPDLFAISAPLAPMTAPPIPTSSDPAAPQAKSSRTGLIVGVGAAVAVAAAVAVFALTRGSSQAAPAVTAAAPPPPPTTAAPAAAAQEEAPKAAAVTPGERPAATQDPKPDPKLAPTAAPAAAPKPAGVAAPRSAPRAAPKDDAPAPKAPAEACDLTCQMQRAVSKKK